MQNIRNIIFDLGGVLLNINYQATENAFQQLGVLHFNELFNQFYSNELFSRLETGASTEDAFLKAIQQHLPTPASPDAIITAWNAMLLDFRLESITHLTVLRKKYRLFLLSNTNEIHLRAFYELFEKTFPGQNFDAHFEATYYSHRLGLRKPNTAAFTFVLNQHHLTASETLFVDDSYNNIEAARELGMQTVHLQEGMRIEQLIR